MSDSQNRTYSDKFMLRLPDGLRDRMRIEAEHNNRSMNAEIVLRLERSLSGSGSGFQVHIDLTNPDVEKLKRQLDLLIATFREISDVSDRLAMEGPIAYQSDPASGVSDLRVKQGEDWVSLDHDPPPKTPKKIPKKP